MLPLLPLRSERPTRSYGVSSAAQAQSCARQAAGTAGYGTTNVALSTGRQRRVVVEGAERGAVGDVDSQVDEILVAEGVSVRAGR